ncbi:MAG: hypothetical protein K2J41_08165 [Eubacterium sp.]|nr:hypothetical protein [Eubacterium sp.]
MKAILISKSQYKKLKNFKINASDKFGLINTLVFRLLVFVDLLGTDVYDRGEIEITIEELYNYCLEYNNILENC